MVEKSNGSWSPARSFLLLTVGLLVVYNSNFRWYLSRDSIPARVLPFSLLLDGHLYEDDWVEPYMQGRFAESAYYVTPARGHLYSIYPLIEPLAITPLYAAPAWWLSRQHPPFAKGSFVLIFVIDTMEKLSASLIAALSAGVLFLALRKLAAPRAALAVTLVYALASNTWSTSSQTLWRQGFTELSFAILLWALLRGPAASGYGFWIGLALALAAANKPAYAVFVVLFLIYFATLRRSTKTADFLRSESLRYAIVQFCVPLLAIGSLVLFYNMHIFGRLLGAYPNPLAPIPENSPMNPGHFPWWHGFAGLLVSPNRGLFVYMPWTILSFWGAARVWKENLFGWGRYLIVGMISIYVIHARLGLWWGGGVFGPRYLCDLLPFFAFFLVPIWPRVRSSRALNTVFVASVVFSFWVQVVGAYFYPNGYWDSTPASIEADPQRVWDWKDTQILRTFAAGPDRPEILYELPLFAQALSSESGKPAVRLAIIGLENDDAWELLSDIAKEPAAELVGIVDSRYELVSKARARVSSAVRFYDSDAAMLDELKPGAVFVATAGDRHLEILRECAKRGIHVAVENPMAADAAEAREMEAIAHAADIKLMVNYPSAWLAANQEIHGRARGGGVGAVQKILVQSGSGDAKGIGVFEYSAPRLHGPHQDAGGVLTNLGADGAAYALWLKGRPSRVFAYTFKRATGEAKAADNEAVILLQYPDATATIQESPNWPSAAVQVEVFGPRGSLFSAGDVLFFHPAHTQVPIENPRGKSIELRLVMHETSSAIAYFIYHLRYDQPIEEPVSGRMNVEVTEVLDAAKESIRTGAAVELPEK